MEPEDYLIRKIRNTKCSAWVKCRLEIVNRGVTYNNHKALNGCFNMFVFLALQPSVAVFSQPGSGL
jgi:hypothetical protein